MSAVGETDGSDGSFEEARTGVVRRLRARRLEIDETIFARVHEAAGCRDPWSPTGLRAAIAAVVDYGLLGIEQSSAASAMVPSATLAQARRAARAGVGLDVALRPYLDGCRCWEDFIVQETEGLAGQRTVSRWALRTSASLLDRLIASIAGVYVQELSDDGRAASRTQLPAGETRTRVIEAMMEVVAERGYAQTSVKQVLARAKVSRRTFYELFGGLEDCLSVVLDIGLERPVALIAQAFASEERWQDGLRVALASLLVFFDSEPLLRRMWFRDMVGVGSWALERRERHIVILGSIFVERLVPAVSERPDQVFVTGVMHSLLGVIQTHVVAERPQPLIEMLGSMMGLLAAHYPDTRGIAREIERAAQLACEIQAGDPRWAPAQPSGPDARRDEVRPATLSNPRARQARECLAFLAANPGSSNREVAVGIGVTHRSQISRLLSQLLEEGLVTKRCEGAGMRNAWHLTPGGEEIACGLSAGHGFE